MSTREVLVQVGGQRVRVWAEGDRLRYAGPKGALTPDLRGALLRQKAGLLKLLGRAEGFLCLTLRQFEGARCCLEVQLPDVPETLWFVSGPQEVQMLRAEGVPRGRIWSAPELRALLESQGMTHEDALAIARTKVAFNCEVANSSPDVPGTKTDTKHEEDSRSEPTQTSLNLDAAPRREYD
jgi:hypothetical protein